ncbi:MAG: ABC transporter ATP-binding protein [Bacteroidia bacterium]
MSLFSRLRKLSTRKDRFGGEMSLKEGFKALRYLPPFVRMVWEVHPVMAAGTVLLHLLQAGIPVSTLYVAKLIVDEVLRLADTGGEAGTYLWTLVGIELALALGSALLSRATGLLQALLGDLLANQTSVRLIEHAARLDLPRFEDAAFYDKLERARQQTTSRSILLTELLGQAESLISIVLLGLGLVVFNPWLILLLVLAVIPAFISETHFNRWSYALSTSWTPERRELDYIRYLGSSDTPAKEVKIFGLETFLKQLYAELSHSYYLANRSLAVQRAGWGFLFSSLGEIGYYVAYALIIVRTIRGEISLGDLTFLAGSFRQLRGNLRGFLSEFAYIAQRALYLRNLFEFFDMEPRISSPPDPRPVPAVFQEGFRFEGVGFRYPGSETYAVRNLDFVLSPGEKLALVGENGAGKTTLVKLLARLYDPSEGRILLDGHDLRSYDLQQLRQVIGIIFQDFERYHFTAADNIAVGRIEARGDQPRIASAARRSLADAVIDRLAGGYGQRLGKRFDDGVDLSGGQWQKIALARAYMRDAQLVILDEPTAALDARAEYEVFNRFAELSAGKMAVLISHRFSTVRMADRILVLRQGEQIEIGTHAELLAHDGLYAELFHLQAQGYK